MPFYGWLRDDIHKLSQFSMFDHAAVSQAMPDDINLLPYFPPLLDQSWAGSCTGHATTEAIRCNFINQTGKDVNLSRLFPYNMARMLENTIGQDVGAQIADVIKALTVYGCCTEDLFPYDLDKNLLVEPPSEAILAAAKYKIIDAQICAIERRAIHTAIWTGKPVVLGVLVFKGFESDEAAQTGIIPMPGRLETEIGGHAIPLGRSIRSRGQVVFRNSWMLNGEPWGDQGNGTFLYDYVEKYGSAGYVINTNAGEFDDQPSA